MAAKKVMYVCYCPLSDACQKGGKRLGSYDLEEDARKAIQNHLERSSYHYMGETEANDAAMMADLEVEEVDVVVAGDAGKAGKQGKGRGEKPEKEDWKSWTSNQQWRSAPYAGNTWGGWTGGKGKLELVDSTASSSASAAVSSVTAVQLRLEQQAVRCEAAARQAARFARQAASAFDEGELLERARRGY